MELEASAAWNTDVMRKATNENRRKMYLEFPEVYSRKRVNTPDKLY